MLEIIIIGLLLWYSESLVNIFMHFTRTKEERKRIEELSDKHDILVGNKLPLHLRE